MESSPGPTVSRRSPVLSICEFLRHVMNPAPVAKLSLSRLLPLRRLGVLVALGALAAVFSAVVQRDVVRGHGVRVKGHGRALTVLPRVLPLLLLAATGLPSVSRSFGCVRNWFFPPRTFLKRPSIKNLRSLTQLRQHPWSQLSIHSHSFVTGFFSHFGSGARLLHQPLVFLPPHLQQVHPPPPALRKSQLASGQLAVDGWDAANVMLGHGVS